MASQAVAVNHWPQDKCARAFWNQRHARPYQQLLRDTVAWLDPQPGQCWIDLGCGSGQLTAALWNKSGGTLADVIALDCAAANERCITTLREGLQVGSKPAPLRFLHADFSSGLGQLPDDCVDGVVSGLAIQYAEFWSEERGQWTDDAYDHLLSEVCRVLRPGGQFVFSVNVPEPAWFKVALYGLPALFRAPRPLRFAKNALRMMRYGAWLKREARCGRFHYLPVEAITDKLGAAGFDGIEHRKSFVGQAFVLRCRRPVAAVLPPHIGLSASSTEPLALALPAESMR